MVVTHTHIAMRLSDGSLRVKTLSSSSYVRTHKVRLSSSSGRDLELRIFGVNLNGRSKPTVLEGFRLKVAELQIGNTIVIGRVTFLCQPVGWMVGRLVCKVLRCCIYGAILEM